MTLINAFEWLQSTDVATAIREGDTLFPWIECVHVLANTFVVGSIVAVDLRLLGWISRRRAFSRVYGEIVPLTWIAFVIAAVTGGLLFSSKAVLYAADLPFRLKAGLLLLAGINMVVFHLVTFRKVAAWDNATPPPAAARLAGGLSLLLWIAVVASGRSIGYAMADIANCQN